MSCGDAAGISLDSASPSQPPAQEQQEQRQGPDGRAQSMCLSNSWWSQKEWQGTAPALPPPNHLHSTAVPPDKSSRTYTYATAMGMGFTAPLRWMASAMEEISSPNSKGATSRRETVETLASVSTVGTMSTMSRLSLSPVDLENRQLPARQGKLMKGKEVGKRVRPVALVQPAGKVLLDGNHRGYGNVDLGTAHTDIGVPSVGLAPSGAECRQPADAVITL
ncbi:hypothetical protein CYMTET_15255 [Cymbomonas tetramitiformis]|uniref:Uncharacterized protein n=1 Tax=Cymbomonas tetramitiformis TaxID=36881 RepID=A0AAE0L975_9CHLO|nr:hypothetical protein CYMTET_15255 [Cymbomonas tetramitiformis]